MLHLPIDERQLDAESGRLLLAYAAKYRGAKRLQNARYAVSGLLAVAGPVLSVWSLDAAGWVGAAAGVWILFTRLVLIPTERDRVGRAVRIQERFDTRLFDLEWSTALAGAEPSEEDIADAARSLKHDKRVEHQHREGWYPSTVGMPWPANVLLAQWSSAAYGRRQHAAYFWFLTICASTVVVITTVFSVAVGMFLIGWLLRFLLAPLPALLDVGELALSHRRLSAGKEAIEAQIEQLWRSELTNIGTLTAEDCRRVQNEAFKLRAEGQQLPEWFYWFHRDRNEANMHEASAARQAKYQAAASEI